MQLYVPEGLPCGAGESVELGSDESDTSSYEVEECFEYKRGVVLKLRGISNPDAASALLGQWLFVESSDVSVDSEDTFDLDEVTGFKVMDEARGEIGEVTGFREGRAYWVFLVKGDSGIFEVPAVKGLGVIVDESERVVTTRLPLNYPGLDDMNDAN